jgi:hypothetical protein
MPQQIIDAASVIEQAGFTKNSPSPAARRCSQTGPHSADV